MSGSDSARIGPNGWFASLPSFPGKLRLIGVAAEVVRWIGGREQEVCLWEDAKFGIDLCDRIQREMWFACYERHITRALRRIVRPGDTFLDVGAHIGYHACFAAALVGSTGHVSAFEADPGNFARLEKNLKPFPQAKAYHNAIWSHEEKLLFERSAMNGESGWGTLASVRNFHKGQQIKVGGVSLDAWSTRAGLKAIRGAKIDAEGSELAVLRGAQSVLEQMRPILLLEMNDSLLRQAGTSAFMVEQLLREHSYHLCRLRDEGCQAWRPVAENEIVDCLAIPGEFSKTDLQAICGGPLSS